MNRWLVLVTGTGEARYACLPRIRSCQLSRTEPDYDLGKYLLGKLLTPVMAHFKPVLEQSPV
jgi:hypothetical protein